MWWMYKQKAAKNVNAATFCLLWNKIILNLQSMAAFKASDAPASGC